MPPSLSAIDVFWSERASIRSFNALNLHLTEPLGSFETRQLITPWITVVVFLRAKLDVVLPDLILAFIGPFCRFWLSNQTFLNVRNTFVPGLCVDSGVLSEPHTPS